MKRSKYCFENKENCLNAKETIETHYPDVRIQCILDKIDENGCNHFMIIDSVDSICFDLHVINIVEGLNGELLTHKNLNSVFTQV